MESLSPHRLKNPTDKPFPGGFLQSVGKACAVCKDFCSQKLSHKEDVIQQESYFDLNISTKSKKDSSRMTGYEFSSFL